MNRVINLHLWNFTSNFSLEFISKFNKSIKINTESEYILPNLSYITLFLDSVDYLKYTYTSHLTNTGFEKIEIPGVGTLEYLSHLDFLNSEIPKLVEALNNGFVKSKYSFGIIVQPDKYLQ
jgi:hypothetical protein